MPGAPQRVVVAGLGSIGRRHLRLLRERSDAALSVVEPNRSALERAAVETAGLLVFASLEAALASSPDIVWLATPTPLHAAQTIRAMEAGAHVFCEKPMSDRLSSALEMKAAAERYGRVLNIGFYLRFWRGALRLRERIREGALGNVLHAHARVGSYITLLNSVSRYQETNPGSLLLDYAHQPDLIAWLLGARPASVLLSGLDAGSLERKSSPNVLDLLCRYREPIASSIHLNYVQLPQRHYYEISGDEGWALLDFETSELIVGNRQTGSVLRERVEQNRDDIFRAQQEAFFGAVYGTLPPETPPASGLISTAICAAALRSWRSSQWEDVYRF